MGLLIKRFDNNAQYETFTGTSEFIAPNVSLILDGYNVHYKSEEPTPQHEYVDLGLPSGTKWATMNVGANSITDYGNYYQYGKGSAQYAATSGQSDYSGMEDPLATSVDTAVQVWGGSWRMPTETEFNELLNTSYCTNAWTSITVDNTTVYGRLFTSKSNGNTLFFPATGNYHDGSQSSVGSSGFYWSSTPNSSSGAYALLFSSNYAGVYYNDRDYGCSIRPVMDA